MVTVHVDIRELSGEPLDSPLPFASLRVAHYDRITVDDYLLVENFLVVKIIDGIAQFDVMPTPTGHFLLINEDGWRDATTWATIVPDQPDVNYTDLPHIDPATLGPAASPEAAWWNELEMQVVDGEVVGDDLILERLNGSTFNAGVVRGADGDPGPQGPPGTGAIYFNVTDYGAVGDGVTDDTAEIQATIAAAMPVNGTVYLPAGTYAISDELQLMGINQAVSVVGDGKEASVIKALTTDAGMTWGELPTGPGVGGLTLYGQPSTSRDFKFDGNQIATQGITLGSMCAHATWESVKSTKVNGDGWLVCPQNCTFINCVGDGNAGSGWVLDYGVGACLFINCHGSANDEWEFKIQQSGGAGWGVSAQPQYCKFIGGIAEQKGSPYFADTGLGGVLITEGTEITFDNFNVAETDNGFVIQKSTTGFGVPAWITLRDCRIYAGATGVYIDAESGGLAQSIGGTNEALFLEGFNHISGITNGSTGFITDSGSVGILSIPYATEGTGAGGYIVHTSRARTALDPLGVWYNSAGTGLVQFDKDGNIYAKNGQTTQVFIGAVSGAAGILFGGDTALTKIGASSIYTRQMIMQAATVGQVPVAARGMAGQTGDLFQAQDSTAAVMAKITKDGAIRPGVYTTALRPTAAAAGLGAEIYDSTLGKPIWSTGTVWKDAAGTTV